MFERRIKWALGALAAVLLIFAARLAQLQLVQGAEYARQAEALLRLRPRTLPFVRGRLLDRTSRVLVSDEPCWEVRVDYRALDLPQACSDREVKQWVQAQPELRTADVATRTAACVEAQRRMWIELAAFGQACGLRDDEGGPLTVAVLQKRASEIVDRVQRIREAVARRRGFDDEVAEERMSHPLLPGLTAEQQVAARHRFADWPWVEVEDAWQRRVHEPAVPLAHVVGRLGRVDADDIASDPAADDPFASYRAQELIGRSGVEWLAEKRLGKLRGRRGQLVLDRNGEVLDEIPPQHGADATLTLRADLQADLYNLLGRAVEDWPLSTGGTIVVLDVASREVLALVSYPAYDPNHFNEHYIELRDETDRLPLHFRAVASQYPPGSIIKPLVCLAGLQRGVITLETRVECTGYLIPGVTDAWRCWEVGSTGQRKAHGSVDVVEALTGSCNVFMYKLGEQLGVSALCDTFAMVGLGEYSGIGLPEEVRGINPTPGYLVNVKGTPVYPAHARLFAIGQGELSVTPVQAASLAAIYASGTYRPLTLVRQAEPSPEWILPGAARQWRAVRQALFNVANHPDGTAYRYAHFVRAGYALCGKTGSATAYPWPTAYRVPYTDTNGEPQVAIVPAGAAAPAVELFRRQHPDATFDPAQLSVAQTWPPDPDPTDGHVERYAHAWFAGFLQPVGAGGEPDWSKPAPLALAVLIEFGGSGGHAAGPVAQEVCTTLLDVLGPDLDADSDAFPAGSTAP